ncbi:hypothetical protein HNR12_002200 [Streptomonospora nanhaiensis]|uniref:Uncharacterized protein n=1 Tax=Streptomonospora nanhaiensis TaxID=1323731 RepID=A0A853BL16_9ACTN|nr:hypothetical protein [Streptomonospora nanhaiensis]NYI95923.1 hypothetical protein [Streptomonospora nanhaiensis]
MNSATALRPDQRVIHVDMGEVVVTRVEGDRVTVADETGDTVQVPADEIC